MLTLDPPNLEDDPAGWRTAVDPKSGRTYWYHKITRSTTWKMPDCLADGPKEDDFESDAGYQELIRMLDGLASPSELVGLLDQPPEETQFEILKILFNCCLPTTASGMSRIPKFIDKLVSVCTFTTSTDIRDLAMRLLFTLAVKAESAVAFKRLSSWVQLCDHVLRWGDCNAALMYSYFVSLLSAHGFATMMQQSHKDKLLDFVFDHCDCPEDLKMPANFHQTMPNELHMFIPHPNPSGYNILDAPLLELLVKSDQGGQGRASKHLLSSVTFLRIIKHALRTESHAVYLFKSGGFSVLQSLCLERWYPQSIRDEGRDILGRVVESSGYIRQIVIQSWLGMATDLSQLQRDFSPIKGQEAGLELEHAERSVKIRSTVGKSVVSFHPTLLWARCPGLRTVVEELWSYRKNASVASYQTESALPHGADKVMDVAIEASDTALAALSVYVHKGIVAPIPARGEPSDASGSTGDLLEIIKVGTELGMDDFAHLASRRLVQELYTPRPNDDLSLGEATMIEEQLAMQRIDDCMHFGEAHGLEILLNYLSELRRYMLTGQPSTEAATDGTYTFTPMSFSRPSPTIKPRRQWAAGNSEGSGGGMGRGAPSVGEYHDGSDDNLHRQVAESLQEVSNMMSRDKDRIGVKVSGVDVASSIDSSRSVPRQDQRRPATASETRRPSSGPVSSGSSANRPKTAQAPATGPRAVTKSKAPSGASGKNKHGSVYELLLKNATGADDAYLIDDSTGDYDYDRQMHGSDDFDARASFEYASDDQRDIDGNNNRGGAAVFVPSRAPGRLPSTGQPKGAVTNKGAAASGSKPAPLSAAGRIANTPKRPQPQAPGRGAYQEASMYLDSDVFDPESGGEIVEFDPKRHSLEPTRVSQSKKRLDALAQPKVYREPYDVRRKAREAAAAAESSAQVDSAETGSAEAVEGSAGARGPMVPPAPRGVATPRAIKSAKSQPREVAAGPTKPWTSDEPTAIPTYNESAPPVSQDATAQSEQPSVDRSEALASLKLLKMKTRGSILKRSASDIQPSVNVSVVPSVVQSPDDIISPENVIHHLLRNEDSAPDSIVASNPLPMRPRPPVALRAPRAATVAAVVAPVAPANCTRASGCKCSLCSVPIGELTSYPMDEDDVVAGASRRHPGGSTPEPARETELQRKRKELNRQKVEADAKPKIKSEKWRMQSMQFRAAISAARAMSNGETPAPTSVLKDENGVPFGMVHCDGCGRNFNPESGARHIAVCKDIKSKPKVLLKGSGQRRASAPTANARR